MMPIFRDYKRGRCPHSFNEWEQVQLLQLFLASKAERKTSAYIGDLFHNWKPDVRFRNEQGAMKVRWSVSGGVSEFEFDNIDLLHVGAAVATRWRLLLPLYQAVERIGDMPPIDLHLGDHGEGGGLTFCENRPGFLLIPDCDFIEHRGYADRRAFFKEVLAFRPWHARDSRCYWRGAPNGEYRDDPITRPRIAMCARVKDNLNFDAKVICYAQGSEEERRLQDAGVWALPDSWQRLAEFQYNIDIDGVTSAWSSLFNKLLSGSCVLKVASPSGFQQWYYDRLVPWKHFVPIAPDLSNLEDTLAWLLANPHVGEEIGANGRALAESLTYGSELTKAAELIGAYAHQRNQPSNALIAEILAAACSGGEAVRKGDNYACDYPHVESYLGTNADTPASG